MSIIDWVRDAFRPRESEEVSRLLEQREEVLALVDEYRRKSIGGGGSEMLERLADAAIAGPYHGMARMLIKRVIDIKNDFEKEFGEYVELLRKKAMGDAAAEERIKSYDQVWLSALPILAQTLRERAKMWGETEGRVRNQGSGLAARYANAEEAIKRGKSVYRLFMKEGTDAKTKADLYLALERLLNNEDILKVARLEMVEPHPLSRKQGDAPPNELIKEWHGGLHMMLQGKDVSLLLQNTESAIIRALARAKEELKALAPGYR